MRILRTRPSSRPRSAQKSRLYSPGSSHDLSQEKRNGRDSVSDVACGWPRRRIANVDANRQRDSFEPRPRRPRRESFEVGSSFRKKTRAIGLDISCARYFVQLPVGQTSLDLCLRVRAGSTFAVSAPQASLRREIRETMVCRHLPFPILATVSSRAGLCLENRMFRTLSPSICVSLPPTKSSHCNSRVWISLRYAPTTTKSSCSRWHTVIPKRAS